MGGDRAADLVGGQGGALVIGFGQHDGEVGRSVRIEERDRVGVADGLAKAFRDLAQEPLDLDLRELLVDVLGVVELDHQDGQRAVVAHRPVGFLADQRVDEFRIPDACDRVHDPE